MKELGDIPVASSGLPAGSPEGETAERWRVALCARTARPVGLVPAHPNRRPHPANGMTAEVHLGDGAYASIIDPSSFNDGGAEWVMRYGDPESIRYTVASLLSSYDYLLSGAINMTEATRQLRILRQARRDTLGTGEARSDSSRLGGSEASTGMPLND